MKEQNEKSFSRGVFIMAGSLLFAKFLGFIYVMPFVRWVGNQGYVLYEYAYKPYTIMIMVATMGIPGAVSKYVAKYNELEKSENIRGVFWLGICLAAVFGFISFFILHFTSEYLAEILVGDGGEGNTVQEVTTAIKLMSFSLLIVPIVAFLRGFMQGHKEMTPTSISQITEQIVRVIIILASSFFLVVVLHKEVELSIYVSILGTAVASISALIVMTYFSRKKKIIPSRKEKSVPKKDVLKELSVYVTPFIFVGASISIFQTIDTFMINSNLMLKGFTLPEAENINAIVSLVLKLIFLPVTLATALSASLIPYITANYESGNVHSIRKNISKSLFLNFFFVLPASVGFTLVSKPIFVTAFGMNSEFIAGDILSWYGIMPIFLSLYTLTSSILQGMNQIRWIIISLVLGFVLKIITNKPLILMYDGVGTAFSNYIGFGAMILLQGYIIQKEAKYSWLDGLGNIKKIITPCIILVFALAPIGVISITIEVYSTLIFIALGSIALSGVIYFFLIRQNGALDLLLKEIKK